jgi:hypothetical protein
VPAFGSSLADGLFGLLCSPVASPWLYSPVVIPGVIALGWLWRADRNTAILLAGTFVVFTLFYAQLGNWRAGRSYGPRYLVPLLPCLVVPLAPWLARATTPRAWRWAATWIAVGALVQLPGVLVDYSRVSQTFAAAHPELARTTRRTSFDTSPLVLNARAAAEAVPRNARYLLGVDTPPAVAPAAETTDGSFAQRLGFSLDLWWLYLYYLGAVNRTAALMIGGVLIFAAAATALHVRRFVRGLDPHA